MPAAREHLARANSRIDALERLTLVLLAGAAIAAILAGGPAVDLGGVLAAAVSVAGVAAVAAATYVVGRARSRLRSHVEQTNALYRSLVERLPLIAYVTRLDDSLSTLYTSPQIGDLLGYGAEEWVADDALFGRTLHPEDRDRVAAAHAHVVRTREPLRLDYRLVAKNGDVVWVHDEAVVVDDCGEPTVQGFLHDVTAKREAQEALRRSEERYRIIVETAEQGIMLFDAEGVVEFANARAAAIFDVPHEEVVGRPASRLFTSDAQPQLQERLHRRKSGISESYEVTVKRRDGTPIDLHVTGTPLFRDDGTYAGSVSLVTDVTERRRAESELAQFAAIVESSEDGIIGFDLDGRIHSWNDGAERIYGYSAAEALGMEVTHLVPADQHVDLDERISRIRDGQNVEPYEAVRPRKDGSEVNISVTMSGIRDSAGDVVGVAAIVRDSTDLKRLEEQLRLAQRMEAIGQLAGGVAHDFNNSLMAIRGYAELMLARLAEDDPLRRSAERITMAADDAAAVTRKLLAFGRKQMLQPRVLDLGELVVEMQEMLPRLIGEHIELQVENGSLGHVRADPGQVEQIVMNLAVNARDAMPNGGRLTMRTDDVEIQTYTKRSNFHIPVGNYVRLVIEDTGTGMPPDVRERIFEPFFSTKDVGSGTGLGLSMVYGVVKQSQGFIDVTSTVGVGTRFEILLPRFDAPVQPRRGGRSSTTEGGSETVLLVEDEPQLRELIHAMLAERGYRVLAAATGDEAILLLKATEEPVDLVLTDVVMPGMSGPELGMRLGLLQPQAKLVYMSGYTDKAVLEHGALNANVPLLQKPFGGDALARKLREVLTSKAPAADTVAV